MTSRNKTIWIKKKKDYSIKKIELRTLAGRFNGSGYYISTSKKRTSWYGPFDDYMKAVQFATKGYCVYS